MQDNKDIEKNLENYVKENENQIGSPLSDTSGARIPGLKSDDEISFANRLGYQKIPIQDLPTQGKFYPEGTEIIIRAANAGEIRHWSTLNDQDLSSMDDMLNYIIERCVSIKTSGPYSSWKDIKEVDRFYLLLAIREYTFIKGENKLQVKVSETKKIDVNKNMIDYVNFTDDLMQFYSEQDRCFVLQFSSGKIMKVNIPSVGVTSWLKSYFQRKQQMQQPYDTDFIGYAPFVIQDWRGLNDNVYEKYVLDSNAWTTEEISCLTEIKDLFKETVDPVIKYTDDGGMEHTAPLNFSGGIKAIFIISGALRKLGKN